MSEELARLIESHFLNRTDLLANLGPWGLPCPIQVDDLGKILRAHLGVEPHEVMHTPANKPARRGPVQRLGTYTPHSPDPDSPLALTKWVCFDFDGKGHASALAEPLGAAQETIAALKKIGLVSHLERSGGGKGFHVWVFFDGSVEAAHARRVAFSVVPKSAPLADGQGFGSAEQNRGIEIFPKTDRRVDVGNMVWLPWWCNAPADYGEFYREDENGDLRSYRPSELARVSAAQIVALSEELRRAEVPPPEKPQREKPKSDAWADWRARVIAQVDLRSVYGELLTGKRDGSGWLECRDPDSPTGDQRPSASVADGSGKAARGQWHSARTGQTLSIFDWVMKTRGVDIVGASKLLADISGIPLPDPPKAAAPKKPADPEHGSGDAPGIVINGRQLTEVIKEGWTALLKCSAPKIYVRAQELCRIQKARDGAKIAILTEPGTRGALIRSAKWLRVRSSSEGVTYVDDKPPRELAQDFMAYPHPSLPRLDAIVRSPVFVPGGRLVRTPGFDEDSGIYYDERIPCAELPDAPKEDDVLAARYLFEDDLFVDVPFAGPGDYASAMGLVLLPFVRRLIAGPTPLHLIEAPQAGSGKGLIADLASIIFTGRAMDVTTISDDEDDTRKKLTTFLRHGHPLICLDNLPFGSKSANLAAMITAHVWADRVLGRLDMIEIENRAVWMTTVNNPDFNVDLARRCVRIRIDPGEEHPWERKNFKHDPIREWALERRADLIAAALTLVRYWVRQGMPRSSRSLGSFESWARTIGGILESVGIRGFLENAGELYAQADSDSAEWAEFIRSWWTRHQKEQVTSHQLVALAIGNHLLQGVRGDRGESSQRIRLNKALTRMRGRVLEGWRIAMSFDAQTKSRMFALEPLTDEAAAIRETTAATAEASPGRMF